MNVERISVEELKRHMDAREPVVVLDSRSHDAWTDADRQIPGSLRVPADEVGHLLPDIPHEGLVVVYCT